METREDRMRQLANDPSVSLDYYKHRMEEENRLEKEEMRKRIEALELVASYAKDVLDFWPLMTLRTIRVMIPKMAALKEALEFLRGQDRS